MQSATASVTLIPAGAIDPGDNDRRHFDRAALETLAASIAEHGLAQPITVRPVGGRYQIIAGERRFRAISQILGRAEVPCLVRELSDAEASAVMLAENTARVDLSPIEEARAYQTRIDRFGATLENVAETAGVSVDRVKRRLSLLKLIPDAQHLVARGLLPIGHAEALTVLDSNRQLIALRILQERDGIPLATFRQIVGGLLNEQSQDGLFDLENFWVQQVQAGTQIVRRGKRAVTGAPKRSDIPTIRVTSTDDTGAIIDRYIADLLAAGFTAEAGAIGTLYETLVQQNFAAVPLRSELLAGRPANDIDNVRVP